MTKPLLVMNLQHGDGPEQLASRRNPPSAGTGIVALSRRPHERERPSRAADGATLPEPLRQKDLVGRRI